MADLWLMRGSPGTTRNPKPALQQGGRAGVCHPAMQPASLFIGTAGWGVPSSLARLGLSGPSTLARYAACFAATEINTSFYRSHRPATYARWAASVPSGFRFAVKMPRTITHERRLVACTDLLRRFAEEIGCLGPALGPVLVQLPPSLRYEAAAARGFLAEARQILPAPLVCEPRHPSWFGPEARSALREADVARVGADPPPVAGAEEPNPEDRLIYLRLHGSPHRYYTPYGEDRLRPLARRIEDWCAAGRAVWCIFDNTAAFAAPEDALILRSLLAAPGADEGTAAPRVPSSPLSRS